ncbi:hypothetical protein HKBW3S03_01118 [Candidatus Hakubella thermalkaliphila]|uniref:Uncharacterized protein n=2 Tax=Candidatus Hakubella thermalkaliphila TaxID=2754717 RepID=A0A6V8NV62_9ACTN|nr:hypothetical protein [Candidatus Hakubella thermalkaliphila]GFP19613.1 hypothetical protein HKBW3S03_01118 [Candidatus Hakubella thermalkaliphila]GFP23344.1 hypothetical protein HKBW3S09_00811 [Candidatus Hakubella thermalkaliphila]GFP30096.1 hypothetical protein HKBW3S34_01016 [Candidatus Hakubella thermalkaliphila]GFP36681.1 hypothetical protein HKBW3S44_00362 [Candidatus Hakubella thermalkaliphila]GFP39760.1 hypothetical protein HKBW3S47_01458 [Candidatus Hakubella thermalkaliphila]
MKKKFIEKDDPLKRIDAVLSDQIKEASSHISPQIEQSFWNDRISVDKVYSRAILFSSAMNDIELETVLVPLCVGAELSALGLNLHLMDHSSLENQERSLFLLLGDFFYSKAMNFFFQIGLPRVVDVVARSILEMVEEEGRIMNISDTSADVMDKNSLLQRNYLLKESFLLPFLFSPESPLRASLTKLLSGNASIIRSCSQLLSFRDQSSAGVFRSLGPVLTGLRLDILAQSRRALVQSDMDKKLAQEVTLFLEGL